MELSDYIRQVGPKSFAEQFDVSERAAISWMYRARNPRIQTALKIIAQSPVTLAGIYGDDQKLSP